MNGCKEPFISECNSSNYCIENNDWRPTQEILLTRFAEIEYSDMFRTINQDYGSFYYRKSASSCTPDTLKEKLSRRHERFSNWLVSQASHRHPQIERSNLFPQCNTQTVTITHRKKFCPTQSDIQKNGNRSTCSIDDLIIDFLVKQIQQRLQGLIDPNDYDDVFKCAKILVTELLTKEPSLCADDVINQVIALMNTPFCSSNIINRNNQTSHPVTPPSSSLLAFSNPVFGC